MVVLLVVLLGWVALLVGARLGSDGTEAGVAPDASGDVFGEVLPGAQAERRHLGDPQPGGGA